MLRCCLLAGLPMLAAFAAMIACETIVPVDAHSTRLLFWGIILAGGVLTAWRLAARVRCGLADQLEMLDQALAERNRELYDARLALENQAAGSAERQAETSQPAKADSEARACIMADLSHAVRTQMHGILGMTDLVIETGLNDKQREDLETARTSADALMCVINNLFDFTLLEAGKLALESADFRLRQRLNDTAQGWSAQAIRKGLKLGCHVLPDVPDYLLGDANRLMLVLSNLVGNAVKFTPRGRVDLYVKNENALRPGAVTLRFSVYDTGPGMSSTKRQEVSRVIEAPQDRFTAPRSGAGVGLAISACIVAQMNGRIWFETEEDHGAVFHVTACFELPRQPAASEPPQAEAARAAPAAPRRAHTEPS